MPNWLKIVFAVLILILLGVLSYLGYTYFSELKKTDSAAKKNPEESVVSQELVGSIFCIEEGGESTESSKLCTRGLYLDDDKAYQLSGPASVGINNFAKGDRVRVIGLLDPNTSPLGLEGTFSVTAIEKIN